MRLVVLFFAAFVVSSFSAHAAPERPLRVVTLHTVLTEIAREVGGDQVTVNGLVKGGIDPHSFDPSAADIRAIVEADLVLAAGLNLEGYLDRLADNTGGKARVLKVGDALPNLLANATPAEASAHADDDDDDHDHPAHAGHTHAHSHAGERDPHWWHSITAMIAATDLVRAEYTKLRPAAADTFARNARLYTARLTALKTWATAEVAKLPSERRQLVTSHDAFSYFAREFGFTVHPISGFSSDSEPDAKHLASLVKLIRREKIRAIFPEASANPRVLQNLVRETGVIRGGELYADGLGPIGGDAETYEAMVRHNITTIVTPLK